MNTISNEKLLKGLAVVLVLGAIQTYQTLPYAYFQIMTWAVCTAAIVAAIEAYRSGNRATLWLFGVLAVVFNPIAPVYLSQYAWRIADIIAAIIFTGSFFQVKIGKS